jgi:hypothetical protein
MRFRFVISHAILGSLEVNEFDGWKESVLKLERHEEFHSLIEYFDGSFILYGNNGIVNGGIDFVKEVEQIGLDETITVDIDVTFDDITFSNVFNGQYKLTDLEELPNNKMRIPIIRDDFWAKFISRLEIPVNLRGQSNQDDEPVSPAENIILELPSQKIRYNSDYGWGDTYTYYEQDDAFGDAMTGLQLDWEMVNLDDLKKFTLPRSRIQIGSIGGVVTADTLVGNFEAPYNGDYLIDIKLYTSYFIDGTPDFWSDSVTQIDLYVMKSNETVLNNTMTKTVIVCGIHSIVEHSFTQSIRLQRGEQIVIFGIDSSTNPGITFFGTPLTWHNVVVASTTALVLSGEQTIDGISTSTSHILAKNQGDPSENGVWVTGAGSWTRPSYADTPELLNEIAVYVTLGTQNADTAWKQNNEIETVDLDDQVWIYILPSDERRLPFPCGLEIEPHLTIIADTFFPPSEGEAFLIHDVGAAISDRIIGQDDTFYSELMGSQLTRARQYEEEGCAWAYGLLKGLQARQYTLSEKPFFMSFNQWWRGANPVLNLSLMYDTIDGQPVIRVEEKAAQYIDDISVYFSNVSPENITRKYDNDRIFNKIEVGYTQWQAEDISGIDDPQTKKIYSNRFKKVGKTVQLLSEFIGASLAIETTRRKKREKSSDWKYDNETFIIALNPIEVVESPDESPDLVHLSPELDEDFSSITNLVNSETRYNLRITTARNFLRWQNYLQGSLQSYLGSVFKFSYGEGNYDMTSVMDAGCPDEEYGNQSLDEKGNIEVTADFLHLPILYEIDIPMEWSDYITIRDNRRKAIGVSLGIDGHVPMFIKTLDFRPVKGTATILAWAKEYLDLAVVADTTPMQECQPESDECETALTDENGNNLTDELGICIYA